MFGKVIVIVVLATVMALSLTAVSADSGISCGEVPLIITDELTQSEVPMLGAYNVVDYINQGDEINVYGITEDWSYLFVGILHDGTDDISERVFGWVDAKYFSERDVKSVIRECA